MTLRNELFQTTWAAKLMGVAVADLSTVNDVGRALDPEKCWLNRSDV